MSKKSRKNKKLSFETKKVRQASALLINSRIGKGTIFKTRRNKIATSNTTTGSHILSGIRSKKRKESIHFLRNILSTRVSRDSAFNCVFPKDLNIKDDVRYIDSNYGIDYDIEFESHILSAYGEDLKEFLFLQNEFDSQLLNGELINARDTLDKVFHRFGYSNWFMSSKLNLIYEEDNTKKFIEYNEEIANEFKTKKYNRLSEVYINYAFIRCDKGVSYDRYSFAIQHQSEEFILSNDSSNIEQIDFAHVYSPEKNYRHLSALLCDNSANNMIDRFLGFKRLLVSCFLHDLNIGNASNALKILYEKTKDKVIENILYSLGILNPVVDEYDILFVKACDNYVKADYSSVIIDIETLISKKPTCTSIIEMYVKSLIREGKRTNGESLINKLINHLIDLYIATNKAEKIKHLQKEFLRLYHCDWAYFLKLQCEKFTSVSNSTTIEKLYAFLDLNISLANPFSKIRFSKEDILLSGMIGISYNALDGSFESTSSYEHDASIIDKYRYIKIKADALFQRECYKEALDFYHLLSLSNDPLYKSHGLSRRASCHLFTNEVSVAIHELSILIKESYNSHLLPLAEAARSIIASKNQYSTINELIESAIVLHSFNMTRPNEHTHYLTLLCEEIIDKLSVETTDDIEITENNYYFYEKILKPDIIETFDIFNSLREVYIFRIISIQHLISFKGPSESSHLKTELFRSIEKLVKETCKMDCGTGRIEVDTISIKNNLSSRLSPIYEALKLVDRQPFKESDYREFNSDKKSYSVSSNEFFSKTLDLYYKIRDEYTISPLCGLDNFLNMNIRHGGIVNLLWGPIKNHKLAYLKNEKGLYERENYWFEQYVYMRPECRDLIDLAFRKFTKSVEKEIQTAKGWIHINTGEFSSEEKAFNFFTDAEFIESIADTIDKNSNFEQYCSMVIDDLNMQTDIALLKIKELIESTLRSNLDKCFSELLIDISDISRLDELNRKIKLAQREVNDKVTELIGWMEWKNETTQPFYIGSSIDSAKEMAQSLHPGVKINISISDQLPWLIRGGVFRRFTTIFLILIDNAIIHSGYNNSLNIFFSNMAGVENSVIISMSNLIAPHQLETSKSKTKRINSLINTNYIDGANEESGSGLFKIKKIITYDLKIKNHISLSILDKSNEYKIDIILDKAGMQHEH